LGGVHTGWHPKSGAAMRRILFPLFLAGLLAPAVALADTVVPSDEVHSRLLVRAGAGPGGSQVGSLRPSEHAAYLETRDGWHQVRLADGTSGFVSAAWSRIVPEPGTPAAETAQLRMERPGMGDSVRRFVREAGAWLGVSPRVELVLEDPVRDGAIHEHDDPMLPVAGLATPEGATGNYDLVLAIDASTSTQAFSHADVNDDGRLDEHWKGPDSIYQAQIRAARELVAALGRLPNNRDGERIRVGVVSFAGEEQTSAAAFDASPVALLELARLDAQESIPVTGDYARLDRELELLAEREPAGMTDFAAGVGSSLAALGVLSSGVSSEGPRDRTEKAILFLTDGKPQLPGDRQTAERAALYASRLAGDAGVRIHTFALGRDPVRRDVNPVLERMARLSGGRFAQLEKPGEIVALLRTASFSFVREVRLVNRTRGDAITELATGIDGSFFGELPLVEGPNEIEVEAVLNDGRRTTRRITVRYVDTKPIRALEQKLASLREENSALVEQLRGDIAGEIETARAQQHRDVAIRAEPTGE
jgi:hypothetical protein